ncbi:MAG: primosomal protein N' [Anaerolineales bacterium]
MKFVEVAVNLPAVRGTFHYHLPSHMRGKVGVGHLVTAQFGHRPVQGVVIDLPRTPEVAETRPIEDLLDPEPVLTQPQLQLARWMAEYYRAPLIESITLMLPSGLSQPADSEYTLVAPDAVGENATQRRLIQLLAKRGPLRGRQIARSMSRMDWRRAADRLVRDEVITRRSVLNPPRVSPRTVRTVNLSVAPERAAASFGDLGRPGGQAALRRKAVLESLLEQDNPLETSVIYAETGANSSDLRYLEQRGLVSFGGLEVLRDPVADLEFVAADPPKLMDDQRRVWSEIQAALKAGTGEAFLLHGVTGSGKTEIYLRAVGKALENGRSAIVLVPEIALTPQTLRRFMARFPGVLGVLHSQLSEGERYDTWRRARSGSLQVMVGPRSALFAPLANVGLIVVDESHDESYKEQGQAPRYHARQAALEYARINSAVCILGTATPDLVTTFRAGRGELTRLALPQRILGHREKLRQQASRLGIRSRYKPAGGLAETIDLPPVRVVDMRQELRAGNRAMFSRALQRSLGQVLESGQQAILFLNRRGTTTYVFCRDCGHVMRCSTCDSPLTFHSAQARLLCHHCGRDRQMPEKCPNCGSSRIKQFGAGTQRVQAEVEQMFPGARTLRWDRDTTRGKGAHDTILSSFAAHEADVLIGTQMVAKGLDLPLVTLVGVVLADIGLNLPDYRSPERTFQVLSQVAGRAGRGLLGGHVVLQTYEPEHYAIQAAAQHNYDAFYEAELEMRRQLEYPPYKRLARLIFRHTSEEAAQSAAERMAGSLEARIRELGLRRADLIGPVPAYFRRVRGEYRWMVVIRASDPTRLLPDDLPRGWTVDIDPVSLL